MSELTHVLETSKSARGQDTFPEEARVHTQSMEGTRSDWKFVLAFGLFILLVTSIPYAWAYISSPPNKVYLGLDFAVYDYSQYMSWARESATHILVENKLTSEANPPAFFNLLWWAVGRFDSVTGVSFQFANQLLRVIFNLSFLFVAYWFCSLVLPERSQRRFALAVLTLSSGFGWMLVVLKSRTGGRVLLPTTVYTPVGDTFWGFISVPHHIVSATLVVAILGLVLRSYRRGTLSRLAFAGLLTMILGLEHTYDLVTVYAVIAVFTTLLTIRDGLRLRWVAGLAVFALLSAPAGLFWAYLTLTSSQWREVLAQYANLGVWTPNPFQLVILLGPAFLVALLAFRRRFTLTRQADQDLFLCGWFVINLLIIYLPVTFQIMMLNGFQVVMGVLATRVIFEQVIPWCRERVKAHGRFEWPRFRIPLTKLIPAIFLLMIIPTNVYILGWRVVDLNRHDYPYYLDRNDVSALAWLDQHAAGSDVVFSSLPIGIYVPGTTGAHAFLAHGAETLDFQQKNEVVHRFFETQTTDTYRREILRSYHVTYVFYGPSERRLGSFAPSRASYLVPTFESEDTQIYRVRVGP